MEVAFIKRITSLVKTEFDKVATYTGATKHIDDFDDNDLINKQAAIEISSGVVIGAETVEIPTGSVLTGGNFNVDYVPYTSHGNYPRLELNLVNVDGSEDIQFTGIHKNKTAGDITSIDVFLADDGTGHSAFDYVLVIQ